MPFLIGFALLQAAPIGSALSQRVELLYESDGVEQSPWVYDSVRVVEAAGFERCVLVARQARAARESCVRADTLFERGGADAQHAPSRPIGPNMRLEAVSGTGNILHYATGELTIHRIAGGLQLTLVPTAIVIRDAEGAIVRRLREHYAPALLTAVWGVFEELDPDGGWRSIREFVLNEVRPRPSP